MPGPKRPSGAYVYPAMVKTAFGLEGRRQLEQQVRVMRRNPWVFAAVLTDWVGGYVMPIYGGEKTTTTLQSGLQKLRLLWESGVGDFGISRHAYYDYVVSHALETPLMPYLREWRNKTRDMSGTQVRAVHGDATIDNLVGDDAGAGYWIDPNPRPVPKERELDLGKLWQSVVFGDGPPDVLVALRAHLLNVYEGSLDLQKYYLLTHLARLWRYLPDRRESALHVAQTLEAPWQ